MKTYVISEIGSNHNKDLSLARELIHKSAECGANAAKFQVFSADGLYSKCTQDFDQYESVWSLIKELEVPYSFFEQCKAICDDLSIDFLASGFDIPDIDFLISLGVKNIKVASFELTDIRLIRHIANTGVSIIASTGLASADEIAEFLRWCEGSSVALLHCNSAYPTPDEEANLKAVRTLIECFHVPVGYSDHTRSVIAPAIAVSVGATIIEKHFTLSNIFPGPDHFFALEPDGFKEMIQNIKKIEELLGTGRIARTESESHMSYARRSVVAIKDILIGATLSHENITTKRPASGIPAKEYYNVLGRKATRHIRSDDVLMWEDIL